MTSPTLIPPGSMFPPPPPPDLASRSLGTTDTSPYLRVAPPSHLPDRSGEHRAELSLRLQRTSRPPVEHTFGAFDDLDSILPKTVFGDLVLLVLVATTVGIVMAGICLAVVLAIVLV